MKIVFPVRFAVQEGLAVQTTSLEMTDAGVFVVCPRRPPKDLLALQLYLPDQQPPAGALGRVREQRGVAEGFWLDLIDRMRGVRERVEALARRAERPTTSGASPHRAMPRYPTTLAAALESGGKRIAASTRNLSASGVFVHTTDPAAVPVGSVVGLRLALPDRDQPVPVQARVVHRVEATPASMPWTEAGLGLQFIDGDDAFRARIDRHLARIAKP